MKVHNGVIVEQMREWAKQLRADPSQATVAGIVAGLDDVSNDVERSGEWTEIQERLLFAAQAVVGDADYEPSAVEDAYSVDRETLDALKAVVKQISDDAEQAIRATLAESKGGKA